MASKKTKQLEIGGHVRKVGNLAYRGSVTKENNEARAIPNGCIGTITDSLRWRCSVPSYQAYTVRFDDADGKPVVWAFLKPDEIEAV